MASWTEGERAPLLPPVAQQFLKRRGAELTGFIFLVVGLAFFAALASYHPDDPSWMNATERAPQNWLGAPGALLADPLLQVLGLAAWGLPLALIAWGLRLVIHIGDDRAWSRVVLTAPALMIGAIFASTHAPVSGWSFSNGLGGVFGDGALSMLLSALPMPSAQIVKPVSLVLALVTLLMAALSLGVNFQEAGRVFRYLARSLKEVLAVILSLVALITGKGVRSARDAMAKPRSEKHAPPPPVGARRRSRPLMAMR